MHLVQLSLQETGDPGGPGVDHCLPLSTAAQVHELLADS